MSQPALVKLDVISKCQFKPPVPPACQASLSQVHQGVLGSVGTHRLQDIGHGGAGWHAHPVLEHAFAHQDFARQPGTTVKRHGQGPSAFVFAVEFHLRPGGLEALALLVFLGVAVIEHGPGTAPITLVLNRCVVVVINA